MIPIDAQFDRLKREYPSATKTPLPSGAQLVEIGGVKIPKGWNTETVTILFLAPAGYPGAQPDCFWAEPKPVRLQGDRTPKNTQDSNSIPEVGPRGTWFSWHVQQWNPNSDDLITYMNVILRRFNELE